MPHLARRKRQDDRTSPASVAAPAEPPAESRRTRFDDRPLCLLIVIATFAALSPVLAADFTNWDDPHTIAANPLLNPPTLASLATFWNPAKPQASLYVPVTYTLWSALAAVAYVPTPDPNGVHLNPLVFHAANLALHASAALVAYALLKRLTRNPPAATAGALLFALHPVQVESVAWASGTKDVLWGLLALVALWQYLRFADHAGETSAPRRRLHYAAATAAFVLAMLAKPTAVVVPLVAGAIDLLLLRRPIHRPIVALLPWLLLTIPVLIVGTRAQPAERSTGHDVPPALRPALAADAVAFYARKVVWPGKSGVVYDHSPPAVRQRGSYRHAWIIPALLLGLAAIALWQWRAAWPLAALATFVLGVVPVLGLVPFEFQRLSMVSDHYLYLSLLGPALALTFALSSTTQMRIPWAACGFALLLLAPLSFAQARTWRDSITLFEHAIRVNPNEFALRANLSLAYHQANRFGDAIRADEAAVARWPDVADARVNLAGSLARVGRLDDARAHAAEAMRLDPASQAARLAAQRIGQTRATTRAAEPRSLGSKDR